ncbi:TPM domain-containing protein [Capnocytophaga canimorsus]|uniref:TPM domain-containing protein n=1 Tax=Capnocytophaga canimorsus TaxID=28188 RepID=UPI0037D4384C
MNIEQFLTPQEEREIIRVIGEAEKETSGEIRVHLENTTSKDPYLRAMEVFEKLDMPLTAQRNGVLFYFAVEDKTFVIFGDKGINNVVEDDFWESTKDEMLGYFREGKFKEGIVAGIRKAGKALQKYFPYCPKEDVNELTDDISKGNI